MPVKTTVRIIPVTLSAYRIKEQYPIIWFGESKPSPFRSDRYAHD